MKKVSFTTILSKEATRCFWEANFYKLRVKKRWDLKVHGYGKMRFV